MPIRLDPKNMPRIPAATRSNPVGFVAHADDGNSFFALDAAGRKVGVFRGFAIAVGAVKKYRAAEGRQRRPAWPEVPTLAKGAVPELIVQKLEIDGREFVDLRVHILPNGGELYATVGGVSVPIEALKTVIDELTALLPKKKGAANAR